MSLIQLIRRHFGSDEQTVYECRHCGETLEPDDTTCPSCGSDDVAQYNL